MFIRPLLLSFLFRHLQILLIHLIGIGIPPILFLRRTLGPKPHVGHFLLTSLGFYHWKLCLYEALKVREWLSRVHQQGKRLESPDVFAVANFVQSREGKDEFEEVGGGREKLAYDRIDQDFGIEDQRSERLEYDGLPLGISLPLRSFLIGGCSGPSRCHGVRVCFSFALPKALSICASLILSPFSCSSMPFLSSSS